MVLKMFEASLVFILLTICTIKCDKSDPVVTVAEGQLRGSVDTLLDGSSYYSFKGIPYASPPLRFAAPEPPKPWDGVYDATKHGPICVQFRGSDDLMGEENCLYHNIYTKSLDKNAQLPVMVFIHGGTFMMGSGDTDTLGPDWLLQHDVILVTINYRLDVFGFITFEIPEAPGNAGLRDQVAALKWIQNNIAQFGGDPNSVTIFGESAGAVSVTFHIQSSMSKGLFQKAIAQSGVSFIDMGMDRLPSGKCFDVAKTLGNFSTNAKEILIFLRSVPTVDLMIAAKVYRYMPVVEQKFEGVIPFISDDPLEALLSGDINDVPLILGYTSEESILFTNTPGSAKKIFNDPPSLLVPRELEENISEEQVEEYGQSIKDFFVKINASSIDEEQAFGNLMTDIVFVFNIHRYAFFYSKLSKTYLYRFSCFTDLSMAVKILKMSNKRGVSHADDVAYLFNNAMNINDYKKDPKLQDLVFRITKLWTDFAKTGDPTPDDFQGVKWPLYDESNMASLEINEIEFTAGENADKKRIDFWNQIYCKAKLPSMCDKD